MFVQGRTVEASERESIAREMSGDPVQEHADAVFVHVVHEPGEILRRTVARGRRIEPGHLIAPRLVQRMFHHGEQFHMRIAHFPNVIRQRNGKFAVVVERLFHLGQFQPGAAPCSEVYFIYVHGAVDRIRRGTLLHPRIVGPLKRLRLRDDAGVVRTQLRTTGVRVELQDDGPVRTFHLEFIYVAGLEARDEEFPDAGKPEHAHRMSPTIPAVEVADHGNALCVWRPHRERNALDSAEIPDMRSHYIVNALVFALIKQVNVHLAECGQEAVRIGRSERAVRILLFDFIREQILPSREETCENPLFIFPRRGITLVSGKDRDGFRLGIVDTDHNSARYLMHAEELVRITAGPGKDLVHNRVFLRIGKLFHGKRPPVGRMINGRSKRTG